MIVYRNLGAMLHVNGKWQEAEYNYRQALQLVPDDQMTLINLKKLHQFLTSKGIQLNQQSSSLSQNETSSN